MTANRFCSPWVLLLLVLAPRLVSAAPRLGVVRRTTLRESEYESSLSNDVSGDMETFFYTQTLDHFNYRPESYATFQQRYVMNSKYWGGAKARSPIFVYLGAEAPIDGDISYVGLLPEHAPQFKALIVFIEHRYYGKSIPFSSRNEAFRNASTLGYFSSSQALADYAEIILSIKKNFSADSSPVIVFGGSYGGMLATWFRLKYPHVALGALASSAPILYFDQIVPGNGYYSVVSKDYKEENKRCYNKIRRSWSLIDQVAAKPGGLAHLSQTFNSCLPLNTSTELKNFLISTYAGTAQYSTPPEYPVAILCNGIEGARKGSSILSRIAAGISAYLGKGNCQDIREIDPPTETSEGWQWQTCSEMVMQIGIGRDSMFPAVPFNMDDFSESCQKVYGIKPRPHWIVTEFGGRDIKHVLGNFASNIIFSNGLRDPYSIGGVLENISDSIVALTTANGSHCLDVRRTLSSDPQWLVQQRNTEMEIIKRWIAKYNTAMHIIR